MGEKQSHKRKTTRKAASHNGNLVFFASVSSEMLNIDDSSETNASRNRESASNLDLGQITQTSSAATATADKTTSQP